MCRKLSVTVKHPGSDATSIPPFQFRWWECKIATCLSARKRRAFFIRTRVRQKSSFQYRKRLPIKKLSGDSSKNVTLRFFPFFGLHLGLHQLVKRERIVGQTGRYIKKQAITLYCNCLFLCALSKVMHFIWWCQRESNQ